MKKTTLVHIALILAIVVIAGVAVWKLYQWNAGKTSDFEAEIEQVDPEEFDIETLDMIIPMDSSRLVNHEEDNELNILLLGNNPFTDDRTETGIADMIASKTCATVYNGAFPESSAAFKYYPIDVNYPMDHFSLPSLTNLLLADDFYTINAAAKYVPNPEDYQPGIDALESVDMDKIDVIVVMYDSTDYNNGVPCTNEAVDDDVTAFTGGITFFLDVVNQYWPHIRVFVMTPTYALYQDENGNTFSGTTKDLGNGPLPFYVQNEISAVVSCGYSVVDNYYGTVNESNYEEYLEDNMHLNEKGREKVADRIADIINNKMTTVNSKKEN